MVSALARGSLLTIENHAEDVKLRDATVIARRRRNRGFLWNTTPCSLGTREPRLLPWVGNCYSSVDPAGGSIRLRLSLQVIFSATSSMTCATRAFRESPRSLAAQRRVERSSFSGGQPSSAGNRRRSSDRAASTQQSTARRCGQQIGRRRALLNGAASAIARMLQHAFQTSAT
ncbi:hypothetical protein MTO96_015672 [Rhipicephalus appendiculatus]